jgi:hypothetical protein
MLLGFGYELVENGFALVIGANFVGHHVFHADPAMLSNLAVRDRTVVEELCRGALVCGIKRCFYGEWYCVCQTKSVSRSVISLTPESAKHPIDVSLRTFGQRFTLPAATQIVTGNSEKSCSRQLGDKQS